MLSSIQIHNKIVENRAKLDAAEKSFNAAEGDAKDRTDIIYLEPLPLFFK